jgi:hypothetical protein
MYRREYHCVGVLRGRSYLSSYRGSLVLPIVSGVRGLLPRGVFAMVFVGDGVDGHWGWKGVKGVM